MSEQLNLHSLTTESRNSQTMEIHKANTLDILKMINNEDIKVAAAVQHVLPDIEAANARMNPFKMADGSFTQVQALAADSV
jgi:N-acetylmuramic acid 6-phosphate (MurNAc-6-P) etherase